MKGNPDIVNELKELSPLLAGMEKVNVFEVPDGYFNSLTGDVLASLNECYGLELGGSSHLQNNQVPPGYFDGLAETILKKTRAMYAENANDELKALSAVLHGIRDTQVFEVPNGYFEGLPQQILDKAKPQPARIVHFRGRAMSFVKYAVAAAFTGVMALGVFKFTGKPSNTETDPLVMQGTRIANEHRFDEELSKLSDADIVKYLENSGTDVDAAMVASSMDESELPAQEDYLSDEQALDKYLNNIKDSNN